KSEPEHDELRRLIAELRARGANGPVGDTDYDDRFLELMRIMMHHIADEETHLLPAAERLLGDRLGGLGIDMTRRRFELMKPHAREMAASSARAFPAASAAGAAILTAGAFAIGAMLLSRGRHAPTDRPPVS